MLDNPQRDCEAPEGGKPPETFWQAVDAFHDHLRALTPRLIATPAIVAVNVLVFAAMVAAGAHWLNPSGAELVPWGANFGPKTANGDWWRLATSLFVHRGVYHLVINMGLLAVAGTILERMVGAVGFLLLYFFSGIAGSLASLAWRPELLSVGASSAVLGTIGALARGYDGLSVALLRLGDLLPDCWVSAIRRMACTDSASSSISRIRSRIHRCSCRERFRSEVRISAVLMR